MHLPLSLSLQYPHGIEDIPYDPNFAIRGLHCDVLRGLLMKIDAYSHIHLGSVHRYYMYMYIIHMHVHVYIMCSCTMYMYCSLGTQAFPATNRRVINCAWVNTLKAGANTSREGRRWVDAGSRAPLTG